MKDAEKIEELEKINYKLDTISFTIINECTKLLKVLTEIKKNDIEKEYKSYMQQKNE